MIYRTARVRVANVHPDKHVGGIIRMASGQTARQTCYIRAFKSGRTTSAATARSFYSLRRD